MPERGGAGAGGDDAALPAPSTGPAAEEHQDDGLDLARAAARAAAGAALPARGSRRPGPGSGRSRQGGAPGPAPAAGGAARGGRTSGAHPDARDPQLVSSSLARLVAQHGWELDLRVRSVFARWDELVGADVAEHSTPESFVDGRLVVRAHSTAWSTQLRLLAPTLLRRLAEELGEGTVVAMEVLGPQSPAWTRNRLSTRDSRGPRDTYG